MKRWLFFIILCTCGLIDSFTVKSQEALYIFRNDEQLLSAFFYSEIDSITYSVYDEAGTVHNEYVTQIVHTPDSIYQIPLAVIDSVTFVQPETIYQPDARELDARYTPYVKTVDSLTITFTSSLPPDLKPAKGNVLYNFTYQAPFERGFLGRVKSVSTNADGIVVDCDLADITEVFEQYVSCQIHTPDGAETKAVTSDKTETINKDFALEFSHDLGNAGSFTLGGNLNYSATIRTVVLVLEGQKNICIQSTEEYALTATYGLGLEGSVDGAKNILFPIRFPVGILECSIQPQICFEINASATLNAGVTYTFKLRHEYGNINGEEYDGKHEWSSNGDFECSEDLTFEGSALIGLNYQIGIGLPMQSFGVGLDLQAAPQFSGTVPLKPSLDPDMDTKLYESIKDANVSLAAVAKISPCAIVMGKKIWKPNSNKFSFNVSRPIYTGYLFPEFSELSVNPGAGIANISSTVSRDVIFPQKIGYALYDENGGLKETVYSPTKLWLNKDFKNPMQLSFEQLEYNAQYTVFPIIDFWGKNILANPAKTFTLDLDITTGNATDISTDAAVCHGRIYQIESASGITYGICYGTTPSLSAGANKIISAIADENGNFKAILTNLKENTSYYYCAYMQVGDSFYHGDVKVFQTLKNDKEEDPSGGEEDSEITQGEAIDLGLSVKWASHNVGATKIEEAGGLYGWGDPTGKHLEHGWTQGSEYYVSDKELLFSFYGGIHAPENISNTSLDIAHSKWGGKWRMPTYEEYKELMAKCKWEKIYLDNDRITGIKVTGPNGNSIFLPATGCRESGPQYGTVDNSGGYYWTSNKYIGPDDIDDTAGWSHILYFSGYEPTLSWKLRFMGCAVRPVMDK